MQRRINVVFPVCKTTGRLERIGRDPLGRTKSDRIDNTHPNGSRALFQAGAGKKPAPPHSGNRPKATQPTNNQQPTNQPPPQHISLHTSSTDAGSPPASAAAAAIAHVDAKNARNLLLQANEQVRRAFGVGKRPVKTPVGRQS